MNQHSFKPTDHRRLVVFPALLIGCLLVALFGFLTQSMLVLMGLFLLPLLVLLINRIDWWFVLCLALFYTSIYVPWLPSALSLFYINTLAMIPVLLALRALQQPLARNGRFLQFCAVGYLLTIIATIYVRGFGIRALGGEMWGGAPYVHLLIAIGLFLLSDSILLTPKQWKIALIAFFCAGLLPSAAELAFLLSKGAVWHLYYFIRPDSISALRNLAAIQSGTGAVRFQVSKYVTMIFTLSLVLFPFRGKYRFYIALCCLLAFSFAGLSGHRISILYLLLLTPLAIMLTTRRVPFLLMTGYAAGFLCLILLMHFWGQYLPFAFQRSLSWLPVADVSHMAKASAMGTTTWRFEVWRRVLAMVPDYWLVGRGLAFNVMDYYALPFRLRADVEWALVTHNYHSGPLSLLVDLGAAGLVSGSGIILGGAARHWRFLRSEWVVPELARYHRILLASYMADVVIFYLVHGDATSLVIAFVVQLMIMEGLHRTNLYSLRQQAMQAQLVEKSSASA